MFLYCDARRRLSDLTAPVRYTRASRTSRLAFVEVEPVSRSVGGVIVTSSVRDPCHFPTLRPHFRDVPDLLVGQEHAAVRQPSYKRGDTDLT
jgi:hypothetical protein